MKIAGFRSEFVSVKFTFCKVCVNQKNPSLKVKDSD